jgi:hypothetical protein
MYELFIANKNYSSWSLRPWVLMRELSIPFTETLIPFGNLPDGTSINYWGQYRNKQQQVEVRIQTEPIKNNSLAKY